MYVEIHDLFNSAHVIQIISLLLVMSRIVFAAVTESIANCLGLITKRPQALVEYNKTRILFSISTFCRFCLTILLTNNNSDIIVGTISMIDGPATCYWSISVQYS